MHSHMYICQPPLTYVHMSTTFNVGNVDIILQKSFILQICYGKIYFQKNHERIVIHLAKAWCQLCQSWVHLFPSLGQNPLLQVKIEPFRTSKVASTAGSVRPFQLLLTLPVCTINKCSKVLKFAMVSLSILSVK